MRITINLVRVTAELLVLTLIRAPSEDEPETFHGAPIALQVVGRTLEEEAIIGMGEVVDTAVHSYMNNN